MKSKLISLVSNDYWGLYKFRYDIIHMLIRQGYKIILIAKKDEYHKKFNNKNILKHFIKLEHRSVNIFTEIRTMIDLYKIYTDPLLSYDFRIEKVFKRTSLLEKYYKISYNSSKIKQNNKI